MASDKGRFGVLNVLTLRPLLALPAAEPMDYGAESPEGRRLRRESRWTPGPCTVAPALVDRGWRALVSWDNWAWRRIRRLRCRVVGEG
jgi:hypothetical protein